LPETADAHRAAGGVLGGSLLVDPGCQGRRVARLEEEPARAEEVEDEALARGQRRERLPLHRAAQAEVDAEVVRDDVARVHDDRLAGLEVDDVQRAVHADDDLALAGGLEAEAALAAEQVLAAAPLGRDLGAVRVGDPAALRHEERPVGLDVDGDDVAGEYAGHVDPTALRRGRVRGDEEGLAREDGPLEARHEAAAGGDVELDSGTGGHHRAGLDTCGFSWSKVEPTHGERGVVTRLELHGISVYAANPMAADNLRNP
jgi:hypothetical protein